MKGFLGQDDVVIFRHDGYHSPGFDPREHCCDSVFVAPLTSAHERVTVWSRGAPAGTLTVRRGDGSRLAEALLGPLRGPTLLKGPEKGS